MGKPVSDVLAVLTRAVELHRAGQLAEAEAIYRQVLESEPRNTDALHLLGVVKRAQGDFEGAIALILQALEVNPGMAVAYRNLGNAQTDAGHFTAAVLNYQRFLSAEPQSAETWGSLGSTLKFLGRIAESEEAFGKAIAMEPAVSGHRFERALARLVNGDLRGGWEDWEARWEQPQLKAVRPPLGGPEWQGEDPRGKTIMVYAEQGFGDTFQFARYIPLLAWRGVKVIFGAQVELARVLKPLERFSRWYQSGTELPPYDLHCPLMSLPRYFGTTLDCIPTNIPYLTPEPDLAAQWKARIDGLAGDGRGLKVGLVWSGRATHGNDRNRSLAPELLAPILGVPGVQFFSLQKEPRPGHLDQLAGMGKLHDLGPYLSDFADTAAALVNLDLLISVDTSVAHLAGALGRPIWVMLPFNVDWRWLVEGESSPWYPGSKLFRRTEDGEWLPVTQRVAADLKALSDLSI